MFFKNRHGLRLWVILLLTFAPMCPIQAQRTKNGSTAASAASQQAKPDAEKLIQEYRFGQAAQWLQKEIASAQRANKNTERLEAELQRANLGQDMLRGTEKILFVDSFTVARDQLMQTIKLSREAGRLVSLSDLKKQMASAPEELGHMGYINELNDRLIFSATDTTGQGKAIWASFRTGSAWGAPAPLPGLDTPDADRDYPFMMADGTTLYFAAQSSESLGGYDIFVTRYDASEHRYLKPENLGMPFNSPANDYLMGIDETTGLGFFVTDRRQPSDSVCVYIFQPSSTREIYELTADNETEVRSAAQIWSIAQSQTDPEALQKARQRLQDASRQDQKDDDNKRYVISDQTVYHSLKQFRSEAAKRIAQQADKERAELSEQTKAYEQLQMAVALNGGKRDSSTNEQARRITQRMAELRESIYTLDKNMRKAELDPNSPR